MRAELDGKIAVVTGGYGAIGFCIAEKLGKSGAIPIITGLRDEVGASAVEKLREMGINADYVHCDVSDIQSTTAMAKTVEEKYGKIDILVNNAGINCNAEQRHPIHEFEDKMWEAITKVDLDGVYYCSKPVIPIMIKNHGGKIINIGSVTGLMALRNQCAFTAAKAGVFHLTRSMAIELAEHNIFVNAIAPGSIIMKGTEKLFYSNKETAESLLSHIPMHRPGRGEEIAAAVAFLCDPECSYMTGAVVVVDGGWSCGYGREW